MEQIEKKANNITEGVIWKGLLAFFFPVMIGSVLQQCYNMADAAIVGNFVDEKALAAVGGSSASIVSLIINFFVGLTSGSTVVVSQFFGAKEDVKVSQAVHTGIWLSVVSGLLIMGAGLPLVEWMLKMLDTPEDIFQPSALYLRIVFTGIIPSMIYNIGSSILRAVGDARRPLYLLFICCVLNVVLDLLFVVGFRMGVAGVAIATVLAQAISAVLVMAALMRTKESYRTHLSKIRPTREMVTATLRIGGPAALQGTMYSISNLVMTTMINYFGTNAMAGWVVLGKVDGMFWVVLNAFAISVTTFVGQNYGARKLDRARKSLRVCMIMSEAAAVFFTVFTLVFSKFLFKAFTSSEEVIRIGIEMMWLMTPFYAVFIPIEILGGALRGMGDTLVPTIITTIGVCLLRLIWWFSMINVWPTVAMVIAAYPISWILTAIAFIIYYAWFSKRRMKMV